MTRYAFSRVPDSDDRAMCIVLHPPAASRVAMRDVERLQRQNISEDVPACVFGYSRATHQLTDKSGNLLYMATTNPYRLRPIVPATFGLKGYNASGRAALSWVPANDSINPINVEVLGVEYTCSCCVSMYSSSELDSSTSSGFDFWPRLGGMPCSGGPNAVVWGSGLAWA